MAAGGVHRFAHREQAEAGALGAGGDERGEQARRQLRRDPGAGIAERDHRPAPRRDHRRAGNRQGGERAAQLAHRAGHPQRSGRPHRLDGIGGEVEQRGVEPVGVDPHRRLRRRRAGDQPHPWRQQPRHHRQRLGQQPVERAGARRAGRAAPLVQQGADQRGAAGHAGAELGQRHGGFRIGVRRRRLRRRVDAGQDVVEVVRHHRRGGADPRQAVRRHAAAGRGARSRQT